MFKNKKKESKKSRMLEEALDVTSSDTAKALHEIQTKPKPKLVEEDELVVSASTIPDDAPEIGPSYVEETIEVGESYQPPKEPTTDQPAEEEIAQDQAELEEIVLPDDDETPLPEQEDAVELDIEPEPDKIEPVKPSNSEPVKVEPKAPEEPKPDWIWHDNEEKRKRPKKKKSSKRGQSTFDSPDDEPQKAPDFLLEAIEDDEESTSNQFDLPTKDKVDLNSFFEASKHQKKLKRSDRKKYSKRELKRRKKRQDRNIPDEIKDQRVFKFRKKKYKDVEEFITYLNDHYLDIDDVAHDVLADENFFGWVGKKSGVFPQSLAQFKGIKETIEKDE